MKQLTPHECQWIAKRLEIYDIKYAEVYNEVYDHMVSAVESKRERGDSREILMLFQETMDQDIGSHRGIADMTEERQTLVRGLLRDRLKRNLFAYFRTRKAWWFVGAVALAYGVASQFGWPAKALLIPALVLSITPFVYFLAYGITHRYLQTAGNRRKTSLVNYVTSELTGIFLMGFSLLVFWLPGLIAFVLGYDIDQSKRAFISFLGLPGMSVLVGLAFVFVKSTIVLIRTDYRQMVRQVIVS